MSAKAIARWPAAGVAFCFAGFTSSLRSNSRASSAFAASASSLEKDLGIVGKNNVEAAAKVGAAIAERARKAGVEEAYFDRGGFLFHGRVKALADAAREGGLKI